MSVYGGIRLLLYRMSIIFIVIPRIHLLILLVSYKLPFLTSGIKGFIRGECQAQLTHTFFVVTYCQSNAVLQCTYFAFPCIFNRTTPSHTILYTLQQTPSIGSALHFKKKAWSINKENIMHGRSCEGYYIVCIWCPLLLGRMHCQSSLYIIFK